MNRRLTMAATAFAVLLALGACGRKGDLEPPPSVSPDMASAGAPANASGCADTTSGQGPIDAQPAGGAESGNTNRMPDMTNPPC
ncbi:MAG: lipoprotein [Parvibaculum sp.]|uniref:LPS translocon maturation chaperone LptM n=1 Tax=Parvibaculum sp. TaxID=2024848 RepID=UPI0025EDDF47|nr:lipoprotein [Parvibaculum sp.]MCE9648560.1 lipoprotein [Parvibaculum sp.]